MESLTLGFVTVVICGMIAKYIMQYKIYKSSIYSVLYGTFTEFRIRKKSIDKMSESIKINEKFGKAKIIYKVLDNKNYKPDSYVILILQSGFYIIGISRTDKINKIFFDTINQFANQHIKDMLVGTVYENENLTMQMLLLTPENVCLKNNKLPKQYYIVNRKNLIENISIIDKQYSGNMTTEDINHIYQILARDMLEDEKESYS